MNLEIQVATLLFSFLYGSFFFIFLHFNSKFIYGSKKYFSIIITFMFVIFNVLLYFIILRKINNGILHNYCLLMLVIGYIVGASINNLLHKIIKKLYIKFIFKK